MKALYVDSGNERETRKSWLLCFRPSLLLVKCLMLVAKKV